MRHRLAAVLLAAAAVAATGVATAPSASACTGLPCDLICDVYHRLSRACPIDLASIEVDLDA